MITFATAITIMDRKQIDFRNKLQKIWHPEADTVDPKIKLYKRGQNVTQAQIKNKNQ